MNGNTETQQRIASEAGHIREQLHDLYKQADDGEQQNRILSAIHTIEEVEEVDREKNGVTPEDKLAALIESTDECLHCGKPLDSGGWCGIEHMRAYLKEQEADGDE